MYDSDGVFPDDVPIPDATEQQRSTAEDPFDEEFPSSLPGGSEVPLETSPADWQEQQESVLVDPDFDEPGL